LAAATACGSDDAPSSGSGGSVSTGGVSGGKASGGSGGTSSGGTAAGGRAAGGTSGGAAGSAGAPSGGKSQAGASGGTSIGGTSGGGAGGTTAGAAGGGAAGKAGGGGGSGGTAAGAAGGGAAGSSGTAGASGGSGGSGAFILTSPGWTSMPGCSPDDKAACGIFPKANIGTNLGGENKSPELNWTGAPADTKSYGIVMQDLSNATGGKAFVHWAMWNIPGETKMLPAALETTAMPSVPAGSSQRSFNGNGYQGSGKCGNVYEFLLYALPMPTLTPSGTTQTAVADALAATNAPTASLRGRSGAPGCTE
jgi:phosphatidylethanolamine-binding protein (PEBP) family uncharacterized protein